jgi:hypothetical protein
MSKQLDHLINLHKVKMEELGRVFRECPWENEEFYASWCAQSYYFVCHATRILAGCAARLHMDNDALHYRFLDHAQEEKHHEQLYVKDLEFLRKTPQDYPEHPTASFLYQNMYYHLEHNDPTAVFGGVFYLEGASVATGEVAYARAKKAFGDEACTFLQVHVSNDTEHINQCVKMLKTLNDRQLGFVIQAYEQFSWTYVAMMKELAIQSMSKRKAA